MAESTYTIVAEDPGDIYVTFTSADTGVPHVIPLKSLTVQKTTDVTSEYGTGNHEKYAQVQGKIDYKGDFEIGTWWVSSAENPGTWMDLIKIHLTWDNSGLGREFTIVVSDTGDEYKRSWEKATTVNGMGIVTFERCLLTQDSLNIGNTGTTATTKYSFTAMHRNPK